MARTTKSVEEVARLESTIVMLRGDLDARRKSPGDFPVTGCGDGGCEVAQPTGQHTNGGCRCNESTLRRALRWYKRHGDFLVATIEDMREADLATKSKHQAEIMDAYTNGRERGLDTTN